MRFFLLSLQMGNFCPLLFMSGAAGYPYDSSRGKAARTGTQTGIRTNVLLMCMDAQHTKHVPYKLAYHFVWCPRIPQKRFWLGSWQRF